MFVPYIYAVSMYSHGELRITRHFLHLSPPLVFLAFKTVFSKSLLSRVHVRYDSAEQKLKRGFYRYRFALGVDPECS